MPEPYELYRKSGSPTITGNEKPQVPIEIGMMGFSLEDVSKGRKGYVIMPLGARDSTKWGGRRWVRIKLAAMEDVRANRDIIIGNEQSEFKEHTPVELSYEKMAGGYQRVGEKNPLPVTASRRETEWYHVLLTSTAAGNTTLVTPSATEKIVVIWYSLSNHEVAVSGVGLQFGSNDRQHCYQLPASGGSVAANLIDAPYKGAAGEILYGYLAGVYAVGVDFNIGYILEE